MKKTFLTSIFGAGFLSASLLSGIAAEPDGDQILREMSAKLAAAPSFSFQATREIDPGLIEGVDVPVKAGVGILVQRPNKLAGKSVSKAGTRQFIFDGRTLSILDESKNYYTTIPMATSLDGLVDQLDQKYGFTPPLADFALSNPYADFHRQAETITYLGRAEMKGGFLGLGGTDCYRLGLKGKEADAELWIAVSDRLPRKLVATFHRTGQPQLRIAFFNWNLAAPVSAANFTFIPPKGAQKIEMWTTEQMLAARKP